MQIIDTFDVQLRSLPLPLKRDVLHISISAASCNLHTSSYECVTNLAHVQLLCLNHGTTRGSVVRPWCLSGLNCRSYSRLRELHMAPSPVRGQSGDLAGVDLETCTDTCEDFATHNIAKCLLELHRQGAECSV